MIQVCQSVRIPARAALLGLAAAIVCGLALASAPAHAAYLGCVGNTKSTDKHDPTQFAYRFTCDSEIKGYTVLSTQSLGGFSTENVVLDQAGATVAKESFGCEGSFPAFGFSCNGDMTPAHTAEGTLATESDPCVAPKNQPLQRLKFWLVVLAVDQNTDGTTSMKTSAPFPLGGPKCKKAKAAKKHSTRKHARGH